LEGEHEYSVSTSGNVLCEIGILKVETTSSVTQYTPNLTEKIHTIGTSGGVTPFSTDQWQLLTSINWNDITDTWN
jgi:hypothetical protein